MMTLKEQQRMQRRMSKKKRDAEYFPAVYSVSGIRNLALRVLTDCVEDYRGVRWHEKKQKFVPKRVKVEHRQSATRLLMGLSYGPDGKMSMLEFCCSLCGQDPDVIREGLNVRRKASDDGTRS